MLLYVLLFSIIFLWIIAYALDKKDILSPPCILCSSFIIAIVFGIYNIKEWNFNIGERTFMVVIIGIVSFFIGYYLLSYYMRIKYKNVLLENKTDIKIIITDKKLYLFIFIELVTFILIYLSINNIPGDSLGEKILASRIASSTAAMGTGNDIEEYRINPMIYTLYWFCYASTIMIIYKCAIDYFFHGHIEKKFFIIFSLIIAMTLLLGTRGSIIYLIITAFIMSYILWLKKYNWKKRLSKKNIMKGISIIILIVMLFATVGLIAIGREDQLNSFSNNLLENVLFQLSIYIGAPLKLMDLYLYTDYGIDENFPIPGYATFGQFYRFIARRIGFDNWIDVNILSIEFRIDNTIMLGNVYTMFMKYVEDFGFVGVFVLCLIMGAFFGYMYKKIKYGQVNRKNIDMHLIIYSYMYKALILAFFAEYFYASVDWNFIRILISLKIFEFIFIEYQKKQI
ncbi:O-antigen polymerase [Megamonas hypermegale]|uniref:O-antigen polymerase n=1 Tax=Megamonas hypermegale TaxID=158847 RepID=UPI0026EC9213|nr:O-antigen polymerase [Megamonas hypermegale]